MTANSAVLSGRSRSGIRNVAKNSTRAFSADRWACSVASPVPCSRLTLHEASLQVAHILIAARLFPKLKNHKIR